MPVVSSELRVGAFEGRVTIGFGLLYTVIVRQQQFVDGSQYHAPGTIDSKGYLPVAVSLLALVMLRRIL